MQQPMIQNNINISLSQHEEEVLTLMFANHDKLVLKAEFGGGFGGGRVLLIRPLIGDDAKLPTVIKLGPAAIIDEEWTAFDKYVADRVPNVARVEGEPVYSGDGRWGGIRYPLAGDGLHDYVSLAIFAHKAPPAIVTHLLREQLFPSLNVIWQNSRIHREFPLARSLDGILPVNIVFNYQSSATSAPPLQPKQAVQIGDQFSLSNLVVTEVDYPANELTLNLQSSSDDNWFDGYRLRVKNVLNIDQFKTGELLPEPIVGRVQATRKSLLRGFIETAFTYQVNFSLGEVNVPALGNLPNPLEYLTEIFSKTEDIRVGVVHGDLNLENVLIESDSRNLGIHLIDFARARRDWILHDLLRLETSIWLYVVSAEFAQNGRSLADVESLLRALHHHDGQMIAGLEKPLQILTAVRQRVRMLLVNPNRWNEYYYGLTAYLLGALKFKNLDQTPFAPLPKQIAFIAAAGLQKLNQSSLNFAYNPAPTPPPQNQSNPQMQNHVVTQPASRQQAPTQPIGAGISRQQYFAILTEHFNKDELSGLCFQLNIEADEIPGRTAGDKARELITYLERRGRLQELPQKIKDARPNAQLPF